MAKLKVSELFNSIQGEGRYVGVPSLFLRVFGCSFRCPGFNRDHAERTQPNHEVTAIIQQIPVFKELGKTFDQLPLVVTGCDTYAAVYPEFKDFSPMYDVKELAQKIKGMLPKGMFHKEQHLVITGGEPLLPGWQKAYVELVRELKAIGAVLGTLHVTFETNGTQKIDPETFNYLSEYTQLHFSVSTKLSASGESFYDAVKPAVVKSYMGYGLVDFKFVVADQAGFDEVDSLLSKDFAELVNSPSFGSVYIMPVGGTNEVYELNQKDVADLCIKHGYRFSPRLQCILFGNSWNT